MQKKTLYEVEIQHPTNSGEYSTRRIFENKKEVNQFLKKLYKDCNIKPEDVEDITFKDEWSPCGPNWDIIQTLRINLYIINISKINNRY